MDLGPNAVFVWSSYAAAAIVLVALLCWLIADGARHRRKLDRLQAGGVERRSARAPTGAPTPEARQ